MLLFKIILLGGENSGTRCFVNDYWLSLDRLTRRYIDYGRSMGRNSQPELERIYGSRCRVCSIQRGGRA